MGKAKNLTGQKFGRLTVIKRNGTSKSGKIIWECRCDCGKIKNVVSASLINGGTKSCGCLQKEYAITQCIKLLNSNIKHNMTNTRLYRIWDRMKQRCNNENIDCYNDYGGRGIKICQDWLNDFMNFYNWAIESGYQDNLTIDRKDNDGNYEPNNCRWITNQEQQYNKRNTILIEYKGSIKTILELSEITNLPYHIIFQRYYAGDKEERLFRPINRKDQRKRKVS